MRMPKTVEGYVSLIRQIEQQVIISNLKGFDNLTNDKQKILQILDAEISNNVNEFSQ